VGSKTIHRTEIDQGKKIADMFTKICAAIKLAFPYGMCSCQFLQDWLTVQLKNLFHHGLGFRKVNL
jgi:hypothetical protein